MATEIDVALAAIDEAITQLDNAHTVLLNTWATIRNVPFRDSHQADISSKLRNVEDVTDDAAKKVLNTELKLHKLRGKVGNYLVR